VEILDTTEVYELRDAIKAKFPKMLEAYAPAQLVVLTKDATGKLNPLDPNAVVADELGKNGKFEVWVEITPSPAGPDKLTFSMKVTDAPFDPAISKLLEKLAAIYASGLQHVFFKDRSFCFVL